MKDIHFTVSMHPNLVEELDQGFSPMDGLVAIDQMFTELPNLHAQLCSRYPSRRVSRQLTLFQGTYAWSKDTRFGYVQIGSALHVVHLRCENAETGAVDITLGMSDWSFDHDD